MTRLRRATLSLAIVSLAPVAAAGPLAVCAVAQTTAVAPAPGAATTTAPATAGQTTVTVHHGSGNHTAAILLLVLVIGALVGAAAVWATATWSAQEPEWLLRGRHATGEAGWRISNTWAEFRDFLRLGR